MQHDIRHVSFDVWNTLIEPNPLYGRARQQILLGFGFTMSDTKQIYRDFKDHICYIAENEGVCVSNEEAYRQLLISFGRDEYEWADLQYKFEREFLRYPPSFDWRTFAAIRKLLENDISISITSNTNPMSGRMIRQLLLEQAPALEWSYFLFSDEQRVAKPNPLFFKQMLDLSGFDANQVVHVGDHPVCDDASVLGIKSIIIRGPGDVPAVVKDILDANSRSTNSPEDSVLCSA